MRLRSVPNFLSFINPSLSLILGFGAAKILPLLGVLLAIRTKVRRVLLWLVILFTISKLINLQGTRPISTDFMSFVFGISMIIVSQHLYRETTRGLVLKFWFLTIVFNLVVIVLGHRQNGNFYFYGANYNVNSVAFSLLFFPLVCAVKNYKIPIFFTSFTALILILTASRAAQGVAFLLIVSQIISYKSFELKVLTGFLIIVVLFAFVQLGLFDRFSQSGEHSGLQSSRFIMWYCLYEKFEIKQIFIGYNNFDPNGCTNLKGVLALNPHNSWIWAVEIYGFYAIILLLITLAIIIKAKLQHLPMWFAFIIVSNFERTFITTIYDIILYFGILSWKKD